MNQVSDGSLSTGMTPSGVPSTKPTNGDARERLREQFQAEYREYWRMTVNLVRKRRLGISSELSEEIAQAAWVEGWIKIEQFRGESALHNWVNTIASNMTAATFRRKNKFTQPLCAPITDDFHPAFLSDVERTAQLNNILEAMLPRFSEVLRKELRGDLSAKKLERYRCIIRARCVGKTREQAALLMDVSYFGKGGSVLRNARRRGKRATASASLAAAASASGTLP